MYTDAIKIKCVSEHFIEALEKHNISGWKVYDVKVRDKKEKQIEGYYGLSITGRIKHFDTETAYIDQKSLIPFGKKLKIQKGLQLNLSQWDRTDIFAMEDKSYIFINSKAAEVFQKYRFTNVKLGEISEIDMPIFLQ